MQVFGGIGAMKDLPIEIAYRDIRFSGSARAPRRSSA